MVPEYAVPVLRPTGFSERLTPMNVPSGVLRLSFAPDVYTVVARAGITTQASGIATVPFVSVPVFLFVGCDIHLDILPVRLAVVKFIFVYQLPAPLYLHINPTSDFVLTWPVGYTTLESGVTFVQGIGPEPNVESVVLANSIDSTDAIVTLAVWFKLVTAKAFAAKQPIAKAIARINVSFFIFLTSFQIYEVNLILKPR